MSVTYGSIAAAAQTDEPRYGHTVSGYGAKIPTRYTVRLADDSANARPRRVYCMIYGNSGSLYVTRRGEDVFLSDTELAVALGR